MMKKSFSVLFIIFPYITLLYQYIMSFVFEQYTQGNRAIEWTIPLVYLILGLLFGWCIFMKNRLGKREQLFLEIIHLIIFAVFTIGWFFPSLRIGQNPITSFYLYDTARIVGFLYIGIFAVDIIMQLSRNKLNSKK